MNNTTIPCRENNFQSGRKSAYEITIKHSDDKQLAWVKGNIEVQFLYAKTPQQLERLYWQMEIVEKEIEKRAK